MIKNLAIIFLSLAVILVASIPAAWSIGLMFAKLNGVNYYEHGCLDGQFITMVSKPKVNFDTNALAQECFDRAEKIRKQGYL